MPSYNANVRNRPGFLFTSNNNLLKCHLADKADYRCLLGLQSIRRLNGWGGLCLIATDLYVALRKNSGRQK